jgi:hypothetical protein
MLRVRNEYVIILKRKELVTMIYKAAALGEYLKITRIRCGYPLRHVEDLTGLEASTIKRIEEAPMPHHHLKRYSP